MQRKQRGDHQAAPAESSCTLQEQKKQNSVGGVQDDATVVMTNRIQPEQLAVERMGQPGQRMPIRLIVSCESPLDRVPGEARAYVLILENVAFVVVVDEAVVGHGVVDGEDDCGQYETPHQG